MRQRGLLLGLIVAGASFAMDAYCFVPRDGTISSPPRSLFAPKPVAAGFQADI